MRIHHPAEPSLRIRDHVDLIIRDKLGVKGLALRFCTPERCGAAEGEELGFGGDVGSGAEEEDDEAQQGSGGGRGRGRGRIHNPTAQTARIHELEYRHRDGDGEGDRRHAGSAEERGQERAVEVVEQVEEGEEFVREEGEPRA